MPLTPEQIKMLLAKPEKAKNKGRGRKAKDYIDTSVRDVVTWFKLGHKLMDTETGEINPKCSNPNCEDTRDRKMVASVKIEGEEESKEVLMCRRCFLEGWLSE